MPETKEILIEGSECWLVGSRHAKVINPNVMALLIGVHSDDLAEFVRMKYGVEEIFPQSELDKWAESEGYIKAIDND
jgi:hypothetical protein